jgi:hypothetical protein
VGQWRPAATALLGLLLLFGSRQSLSFVVGNVRMGTMVSSIFFTAAPHYYNTSCRNGP